MLQEKGQVCYKWVDERIFFFFHLRAVEMTMDYTGGKDRTEL